MWQQLETRAAAYNTPQVSSDAFLGTIWALTTLSLLFLPARLYARWTSFHRFYWDDFFVLFAWILSLSITASCTAYNNATYEVMYLGSDQLFSGFPSNVEIIAMQFSRLFAIVPMIFYTGLWAVKFAFLLFFRRLGTQAVSSLRWLWWVVTGVTGVCYFACFASLPYKCSLVSYEVLMSPGCSAKQGLAFTSMKVNCVLDVFTDCLIMSIPFSILWRVQLSPCQRIAFLGIFSLVVITITFSIVRAAITTIGVENQMDPIWMYLWTNVELNVAIIVACVTPYRTLFLRNQTQYPAHHPSPWPHSSSTSCLKSTVSKVFSLSSSPWSKSKSNGGYPETWSTAELPYLAPWVSNGDEEVGREDAPGNGGHGANVIQGGHRYGSFEALARPSTARVHS